MNREARPVSIEDLSAYLDGELSAARHAAVAAHLADHPDSRTLVVEYQRCDYALRLAFAGLTGSHPIPRSPRSRRAGRAIGTWIRQAAVAVLLAALLGSIGWWYLGAQRKEQTIVALSHEAVTAHDLYASQPDSGSLLSADPSALSARLTAILGLPVTVPDLSRLGLHLVGLRELTANPDPAALLVYSDANGHKVSCYFKHIGDKRETGFTRTTVGETTIVSRLDEQIGFAVVGRLSADKLRVIAELGYGAISHKD